MLITNHVLSGALVGCTIDDPGRALALGALSHFALDLVPHYGVDEEHLLRIAVPDGLLGLATIAVIASATPTAIRASVLAGIVGACVPDLDKPGRQFFGRSPFPEWFDRFHAAIQSESSRRLYVEVGGALVLSVALAAQLRRRAQ